MSTPSSQRPFERLHRRAVLGLAALLAFLGLGGAWASASPAAAPLKPAFFATPGACVASKIFSRSECDGAFGAALAEIRARGFTFTSQFDCVARFRLCERDGDAAMTSAKHAFRPVMLGIEIAQGPRGRVAKPVFAVETPPEALLPKRAESVVGTTETRDAQENPENLPQRSAELPVDHFERVDSWEEIKKSWGRFQLKAAASPISPAAEDSHPRETPQQRRERLQNAPFIY